jgi:hypothetical protein
VIFAVPVDTLFKMPEFKPIVAIPVLLLLHVPPDGKLLRVDELPAQVAEEKLNALGNGLTETVFDAVLTQPFPSVPVTVYVMVLDGLAVTVAPVVADSPVAGLHE